MKIVIDWCLETDGDFTLDDVAKYEVESSELADVVEFTSTTDNTLCKIAAAHYLEEMFCDLRVAPSHYYIYKSLYRMFDNLIEFIRKYNETDGDVEHTEVVGGNYEGTEITVHIYV